MDEKIFKKHSNHTKLKEAQQLNTMTQLIKKLAKISHKHKKYKFTGNRAMAKIAKGNNYLVKLPDYYRLSVVKARAAKNKSWHNSKQKLLLILEHIKYLTRHQQLQCFNEDNDRVNTEEFAKEIAQDRHHFRFIISPQDAEQVDLTRHARDLVKQMEQDLGVRLKWLGVIHQDTDNSHIHLLIKGKYNNKDLIIKPDYVSQGIRVRSSQLLTLQLGPRPLLAIIKAKELALVQNRVINIDYKIIEFAKEHGFKFTPLVFKDAEQIKLAAIRIKYLQKLNLVKEHKAGLHKFYQIDVNLILKLKNLAATHDIYKKLAMLGHKEAIQYLENKAIIGKVIYKNFKDELSPDYYIIIDGADGNKWYVDLAKHKNGQNIKLGQLVLLELRKTSGSKLYFAPLNSVHSIINAVNYTILDRCLLNKELQQSLTNYGIGLQIKDALEARKKILAARGSLTMQNQDIINRNLLKDGKVLKR